MCRVEINKEGARLNLSAYDYVFRGVLLAGALAAIGGGLKIWRDAPLTAAAIQTNSDEIGEIKAILNKGDRWTSQQEASSAALQSARDIAQDVRISGLEGTAKQNAEMLDANNRLLESLNQKADAILRQ